MPVSGIDFTDCTIKSRTGVEIHYAKDILLERVDVVIPSGEKIVQSDVENLVVR